MFELHITCTKDIDHLAINFSDGTSVVTESKQKSEQEKSKDASKEKPKEHQEKKLKEPRKKLDTYLDTEEDYAVYDEIIEKPIIQEVQRPVNISDELQNLDI